MLDDDVDGVVGLIVMSMHVDSLCPETHSLAGSEDLQHIHLFEVLSAVLQDSLRLVMAVEDCQLSEDTLMRSGHVESVLQE